MDKFTNKFEKSFFIRDGEISRFTKIIGDTNPIHNSTGKAQEAGFENVVAPGVMIMGFISATIAETIPMATIRHLEIKFLNPLYGNSVLCVACTILKEKGQILKIAVKVLCVGGNDIAKGSCLLLIPQIRKRQQKKEEIVVV